MDYQDGLIKAREELRLEQQARAKVDWVLADLRDELEHVLE